jgi:hypothetical protein
VATTTIAVSTRWATASKRYRRRGVAAQIASTTHAAQARCRLGIEAYSFACEATPRVVSHDPQVPESATTSTIPVPGSSRGGATGNSTKKPSDTRFTPTSTLRARRKAAGART